MPTQIKLDQEKVLPQIDLSPIHAPVSLKPRSPKEEAESIQEAARMVGILPPKKTVAPHIAPPLELPILKIPNLPLDDRPVLTPQPSRILIPGSPDTSVLNSPYFAPFYYDGVVTPYALETAFNLKKIYKIIESGLHALELIRELGPSAVIKVTQQSEGLWYYLQNTSRGAGLTFRGFVENTKKLKVLKKGGFKTLQSKAGAVTTVMTILGEIFIYWDEFEKAGYNINRVNFDRIGARTIENLLSGLVTLGIIAAVGAAGFPVWGSVMLATALVILVTPSLKWLAQELNLEKGFHIATDWIVDPIVNFIYDLFHDDVFIPASPTRTAKMAIRPIVIPKVELWISGSELISKDPFLGSVCR